ncbi:MAG: RtcB family protein [Dysgonamonadaceae bacterium]|nr:RtcB family protein [Dysgonamonadaceae bacterium]
MVNNSMDLKKQNDKIIEKKIKYLTRQKDITELIVMDDVENDYTSFSLSGIMLRSQKYLYPTAGGFDLGCGVGCFFTDIPESNVKFTEFFYKNSPYALRRRKFSLYNNTHKLTSIFSDGFAESMLGDVVTGNHFVEIRRCDGKIVILIHSGIPENMKWRYIEYFISIVKQKNPSILSSDNSYLMKVDKYSNEAGIILEISKDANLFACINRKYIAERIVEKMNGSIVFEINSSHEFIEQDDTCVVHCLGVQKYHHFKGKEMAVILSGPSRINYIVTKVGSRKYINHGTPLISVDMEGKRKYASLEAVMQSEQSKDYEIEKKCSPLYMCKKKAGIYEYSVFR